MTSGTSGALAGVTVVVTRPIERGDELASLFAGLGAQVIVMPLIEIVSMEAGAEITTELGSLTVDDWVIAVSTAAANEMVKLA